MSLPFSIYNVITGTNRSLFSIYKVFTGSNQSPFFPIYKVNTGTNESPFFDLQCYYRVKLDTLRFTRFLQGQIQAKVFTS